MHDIILTKIGPLILSAIPISLIFINQLGKIFSRYNPRLGNTTTICTNLTKTLTKDSLVVRTIYFDKYKARIDNKNSLIKVKDMEKDEELLIDRRQLKKDKTLKEMATITILCSFKKLKRIETVLKEFFATCKIDKQKIKNDYEIIANIPSLPGKKFSTIVAAKIDTKEIFALTKGNPLQVLKKCTKTYFKGKKVELTPYLKRKIRKKIKRLNKNGEKAIGFAIKPLPKKRMKNYTEQFTENEMTYVGT
ncbi:hypothetical protein GF366_04720, partial [Candidatus Peregrinibacteria bacterium]|nr:hypothetical protein [Candidatus Peregrinibacteria bacterium]